MLPSAACQSLSLLIAQCQAGSLPLRSSAGAPQAARALVARASPSVPVSRATAPTSLARSNVEQQGPAPQFIDIGANLLDSMYSGVYRGKKVHPPDLDGVLDRAASAGVGSIIVTAGSAAEAREALAVVRSQRAAGGPVKLYTTVGVHPTRCLDFLGPAERAELEAAMAAVASASSAAAATNEDGAVRQAATAAYEAAAHTLNKVESDILSRPETRASAESLVAELAELLDDGQSDGAVVAVGECGLDYERLHFCPPAVQRLGFNAQLRLASRAKLPIFGHNRASTEDFAEAVRSSRQAEPPCEVRGVAHSFDGTASELRTLLELGLDIGLNGCSLKTADNLAVAARVPLDRLHLETDAPWCAVKRSHAGSAHTRPLAWKELKKERWEKGCLVKDRCEPCAISHVLQILCAAGDYDDEAAIAERARENTRRLFFGSGQAEGVWGRVGGLAA